MKRIRWFGASWPVGLRTMAAKMKTHTFRSDSAEGFLLDRIRDNSIAGRYIEKISFQETITDPFGQPRIFERTVYNQLEFNLAPGFPHIEFYDAPRNTQAFMSRLGEYSNFAASVTPLVVDLIKWAEAFQTAAKAKITINSLQISGLAVEGGATAKVTLTSDKDVREALKLMVKSKNYEVDKLQLKLTHDGDSAGVQLSRLGSATVGEEYFEDFLPALRTSLPRPKSLG
jgi:hypothetical protein